MSLAGVPNHAEMPKRFLSCRWRDIRAAIWRWFDRERELVRMRVATGMMAEARYRDAEEFHTMLERNRFLSERVQQLEHERDEWRKHNWSSGDVEKR